jgi:hypothetical protein
MTRRVAGSADARRIGSVMVMVTDSVLFKSYAGYIE